VSDKRSVLDALSAAEKAAVLDELLAARPDLRQPAEAYAAQVMAGADRSAVAGDVEDALLGLGIEELDTRAGYRPGRGYVHPAEAAVRSWTRPCNPSWTTFTAGPAVAYDPQPPDLPRASCSACTIAVTATPRRCWSTVRTTRPCARQVW